MTWPVGLRVAFAVVAWPFVVAGWLWDRPGRWRIPRLGAVAVGALVGVPWILLVAVLVVLAIPVDGAGTGTGADPGGGLVGQLDPPTVDGPGDGAAPPAAMDAATSAVERIVDGDTLYLAGLPERARLVGIDAPEVVTEDRPGECLGPEATAHLAELAPPGTEVAVTFDVERVDEYDRPLVYLHRTSDGLFLNEAMVADGYATTLTIAPNLAHASRFTAAEQAARDAGLGLWSGTCPVS